MPSVAVVRAAVTNGRQTESVFVPAAISWWAVGSALYGMETCNGNPFLGTQHFFSFNVSSEKHYFALWVFGWAFSATAATIVSGAVAERMQFRLAGRSPSSCTWPGHAAELTGALLDVTSCLCVAGPTSFSRFSWLP